MSRKYSLKEQLQELLLHARLIAISFASGGIVLYAWAQLSIEVLVQSLAKTALVLVPAVALLVFVFASVLMLTKLGFVGWRQKFVNRALIAFALGCSFVSMILYVFITDISLGSSIRSMLSLPDGNLFVEGGIAGWTFVSLLAVIAIAMTDFRIVFGKLKIVLIRQVALPDRKKPAVLVVEEDSLNSSQMNATAFPDEALAQKDMNVGTAVFSPLYDNASKD